MRIQTLLISNFRAITDLRLSNLEDTVVIAGPKAPNISSAINRSVQRINQLAAGQLSNERLNTLEIEHRNAALEDLKTDKWRTSFRGREILKKFVGKHGGGIAYEAFRDLVIARMRDKKYQPPGMKKVIDCILSDHLSRTAHLA